MRMNCIISQETLYKKLYGKSTITLILTGSQLSSACDFFLVVAIYAMHLLLWRRVARPKVRFSLPLAHRAVETLINNSIE